jgi:hypothetical protein
MANRQDNAERVSQNDYYIGSFEQLTEAGVSESIKVHGLGTHLFQVTAADVDTNVIVRFEGSLDNTNFGNMAASDTTITADGTTLVSIADMPLEYVRVRYVSESGDTSPTVDVSYAGRL